MNQTFVALGNIYPACGNSQIVNNDFTTEVLGAIVDHLSSYENLDEQGRLATARSVYMMTTNYLKTDLVYGYLYDSVWQEQIEDIKENGTASAYYLSFITGIL